MNTPGFPASPFKVCIRHLGNAHRRIFSCMRTRPSPVAALLAIVIIWQILIQLPAALHPGQDSWGLTDWLVNYAGGFVRRGLAGTIISWVSEIGRIPAHHLAIALSLTSYGLLTCWLIKNTRNQFSPALILSCVMMGFPAFQHALIRKDCLLLLFFIASFKIILSRFPESIKWLLVNLCACTAILMHETFAFFSIPALVLCKHPKLAIPPLRRLAALIPSIACFGLATWRHGSTQIAEAIHQSWMPLWKQSCLSPIDYQRPFATIGSIGWSPSEGISMTGGLLETGFYQPMAWTLVASLSFVIVLAFVRNADDGESRHRLAGLLLFQLICISPLFLLGIDYGRWIFFCITSSVIMLSLGFTTPEPITSTLNHIPLRAGGRIDRILGWIRFREMILLTFGVPILWSARNFLTASPLGRLIDSIVAFRQLH